MRGQEPRIFFVFPMGKRDCAYLTDLFQLFKPFQTYNKIPRKNREKTFKKPLTSPDAHAKIGVMTAQTGERIYRNEQDCC